MGRRTAPVGPGGMVGDGDEAVTGVEMSGGLVDSVHHDESAGGCVASSDRLAQRLGELHGAHREAEVPGDTLGVDEHKGAGSIYPLRGEGVGAQPTVQGVVAGVEVAEVMVRTEPLKTATGHPSGSFGWPRNSSTSSGTGIRGLSSSAGKRSKASLETTMSRWP